jgi:hypothetical protein
MGNATSRGAATIFLQIVTNSSKSLLNQSPVARLAAANQRGRDPVGSLSSGVSPKNEADSNRG